MKIRDRRELRNQAAEALNQSRYPQRKLFGLHIGVSLGFALVISVLNYLLTRQVDTTGGLAGMQLRAVLETARSALQLLSNIAMPFWEIGLVFCAIRLARREPTGPDSLLEGFRRFGSVLRLLLVKGVIVLAVTMVCTYVSAMLFMMTPFAEPFMEALLPIVESADLSNSQTLLLDEQILAAATAHLTPVYYIFGALFLAAGLPLAYRLRFADYLVMDEKNTGAFRAMVTSWKMTRRNVASLVRLDLSFWLFYLLDGLCLLLCYGDVVLSALGITLPVSEGVAFWGGYLVYIAGRLALYTFMNGQVETTYALAYEALRQAPEQPEKQPKRVPWDVQ